MRPLLVCVLLLAAAACYTLPANAGGGVPIPAEYIGIWHSTVVVRDCATQTIIFSGPVEPDTVCAGETFDPSFGQYPLDCTGTATATTVTADCTGSFIVDPECTANVHYVINGTRNGDTWTTTITIDTDYVGTSCPIAHTCTSTTRTATRVDPNPHCNVQPVEPKTWGSIKHYYQD